MLWCAAACFGRQNLQCDVSGLNCEYTANWRTRGDEVEFTLMAQTQGWVGIGFSINNKMVGITYLYAGVMLSNIFSYTAILVSDVVYFLNISYYLDQVFSAK